MEKRINEILQADGILIEGYGLSPKIVMRDQRLSIEAKAIYGYISSYAGSGRTAFPTRDQMVSDLGISLKRYYKHFSQLIDCGYIKVEQMKSNETKMYINNVYTLVSNPVSDITETRKTVKRSGSYNRRDELCTVSSSFSSKNASQRSQISGQKDRVKKSSLKIDIDKVELLKISSKQDVDLIVSILEEMIAADELKISGTIKTREEIESTISKLKTEHVANVLKIWRYERKHIKNPRRFLMACIIDSIYREQKTTAACKKEKPTLADIQSGKSQNEIILEAHPELNSIYKSAIKIFSSMMTGDEKTKFDARKKLKKEVNKVEEYCSKHGLDFKMASIKSFL